MKKQKPWTGTTLIFSSSFQCAPKTNYIECILTKNFYLFPSKKKKSSYTIGDKLKLGKMDTPPTNNIRITLRYVYRTGLIKKPMKQRERIDEQQVVRENKI